MNKYSLDEVRAKAAGISTVILAIEQLSTRILFKTKDNEVSRFLELPTVPHNSGFEPSFIQCLLLHSVNEAVYSDYGKGKTIIISKEVLSSNGFTFSSKEDIKSFAKKLMNEVPQIVFFSENGNGFNGDEIYFRVDYDSKMPVED